LKPATFETQAHAWHAPQGEPAGERGAERRKLVGVVPRGAAHELRALLDTLEQVFPVRFRARVPGELDGLDGVLVVGGPTHDSPTPADLAAEPPAALPSLVVHPSPQGSPPSSPGSAPSSPGSSHSPQGSPPSDRTIVLADDERLARPFRGRSLSELHARVSTDAPLEGQRVLARAGARAVWWCHPDPGRFSHHTAFAPRELADGEALRDHLKGGRFMGLLPLLHLLRRVCAELAWDERPLRAAFVIDDPNLHRCSYGHLSYPELLAHASRHGYHAAFATVPLDGWMPSRRASRLASANRGALSLLMHGNDHVAGELGRLTDDRAAERVLAQALRRTAALERRCGVAIERVMVPPHELCSTNALAAMFRLGYEAACIGRPHPWRDPEGLSRMGSARLVKWHPADLIDEGLPIVPRHPIESPREELVFRAFLGLPLILFAHHWDFADGLDLLQQAAGEIEDLGDVRWESIGGIARNGFSTRRAGGTLHVQLHARRVLLELPPDLDTLRVSVTSVTGTSHPRRLACGGEQVVLRGADGVYRSAPLRVTQATEGVGSKVELALLPSSPLDPVATPAPARSPWPLTRRLLVEARDRARPRIGR
jgi:hypothetical protein